jgi:hypothetical protein
MSVDTVALLRLVDEAFNRKSWHGTNLRGSVRGLTAQQAAWRPGRGRKCIAEIVVHAAYWKYTVRRRLVGEKRGSFPLKGNNWFELPKPFSNAAWAECVKLLEAQHGLMRAAIEQALTGRGGALLSGEKMHHVIRGIAMHDVYHAGQIQTLKALQKGG